MRDPDKWLIRGILCSGCLMILTFGVCVLMAVRMQIRETDEKVACRQAGGRVLVAGGEWYCAIPRLPEVTQ